MQDILFSDLPFISQMIKKHCPFHSISVTSALVSMLENMTDYQLDSFPVFTPKFGTTQTSQSLIKHKTSHLGKSKELHIFYVLFKIKIVLLFII